MSSETDTEKWLASLGTQFIDVWFLDRNGGLMDERHVADPDTIFETVKLTIERLGCRAAVLPYMGRWCVYAPAKAPPKNLRYYDTREAAEMVMIHRA